MYFKNITDGKRLKKTEYQKMKPRITGLMTILLCDPFLLQSSFHVFNHLLAEIFVEFAVKKK